MRSSQTAALLVGPSLDQMAPLIDRGTITIQSDTSFVPTQLAAE
jgi:hypothetical protein